MVVGDLYLFLLSNKQRRCDTRPQVNSQNKEIPESQLIFVASMIEHRAHQPVENCKQKD
jgi:hypothetical protein